jgi:D-serine deaminase-like pyridoxal phosphate-dependent protein
VPALDTVPTPALIVDRERLDRNIADMAARAAAAGVALWPHVKTHKSVAIARRQRAAGAAGFTVATLREAEVLVEAGLQRLLLAQPPVGEWRVARYLALARCADVRVALDSVDVALALDRGAREAGIEVGVLWEIDPGLGRCGSPPGRTTAELVAKLLGEATNVRFLGLLSFPGHAYAAADLEGVRAVAVEEHAAIEATIAALGAHGIEAPVRSLGSTPTARFADEQALATELRPGNYVFHDMTQVGLGVAERDQCALSVLGTVVSRPTPTRLILDSGSKALAAERVSTLTDTFGAVMGHPEMRVERLFEEHAIVESDAVSDVAIGARLRVIPNHACTAANLHRELHLVDGGEVVDTWALDARGWDGGDT